MSADITITDSGVVLTISEAGVVGVGIPAGGSTGQVLTKNTATNYDVSWQTPAGLASSVSTMAQNANIATSWTTVLTANVTQGTWMVVSTLTVVTAVPQRTAQFRIYDPVANLTISTSATHLEHSGEPHNMSVNGIASIAGTQTLLIQAKMLTGNGTVIAETESFSCTNMSVVKIA